MEIGEAVYEITDDALILGRVTELRKDGDAVAHAEAIIPKEAFIEAYNKWILEVNKL